MLDVFPPTVGEGHKVLVGPQPERLLEAGVLYFQDLALNAFNNAKNEFFDFFKKNVYYKNDMWWKKIEAPIFSIGNA